MAPDRKPLHQQPDLRGDGTAGATVGSVVLLYTAPFFVMVLSVLFFREKLTFRKVFALLLSFAGCILVVGLTGAEARSVGGETVLIGLCAGFGYSLYSIFGKVLVGSMNL